MQNFVCALQDWSVCFPQSSGRPIIKSHWPWQPDSLRNPSPFVGCPGWGAWLGVQNLHNSARTSLVLLFSSLWVTHPAGMRFNFIVIASLLPTCCSFLSLDVGYLFVMDFSVLLSMAVQQLFAVLALSQEEMSTCPSLPFSKMFFFNVLFVWKVLETYYVQYYIADSVNWVPRLTLLDLGTSWTYKHALRMESVGM